ncbi:hypothetical protein ABEO66_23695 [Bacillus pacificus]|uniref:hypothetical protein n=1 Tax=Bacillus pacificus TaxID=2026187 RepID=UPI003D207994
MNIIDLELVRKRKSKENKMITIPIIERVFEVNGEIQFEVADEKEASILYVCSAFLSIFPITLTRRGINFRTLLMDKQVNNYT